MPKPVSDLDRELLLALWWQFGQEKPWSWYAEQLGVSDLVVQVWVSRHREELGINVRQVNLRKYPELLPWGKTLARHRNAAARRFLEDEAAVREYGQVALAESRRARWERWRKRLIDDREVITYSEEFGYGTRPGTPEELEVDENGDRRRFAELLD